MGLVKIVIISALSLLFLVGAVAAGYYITDGQVDAEVTETRCASGEADIVTKFPVPGISYTLVDLSPAICSLFTQEGNLATYNLNSERVRLYTDDTKSCLKYDSESGQFAGTGCI